MKKAVIILSVLLVIVSVGLVFEVKIEYEHTMSGLKHVTLIIDCVETLAMRVDQLERNERDSPFSNHDYFPGVL